MLLVVKLPKGKPPFIGVSFQYESEAQKTNADLVDLYTDTYKIALELNDHLAVLKLISEKHSIVRTYKYLGYEDKDKIKMWLKIIQDTNPKLFNFGHIYNNGHHQLVKTFAKRSNFVLKVNSIQIDLFNTSSTSVLDL